MFNNAGTARVLDFDNTCFIAGDDKFTFDTYESVANEIEVSPPYALRVIIFLGFLFCHRPPTCLKILNRVANV